MKKKLLILSLIFIFIPSFYVNADETQYKNRNDFLQDVSDEMDYILNNYYGNINESDLRNGLLNGIHEAVDPWTESYSFEEFDSFIEGLSGDYVGLGIYIKKIDDYILINEIIEGSSAEMVGLKANDRIYEVDGKSLKDLDQDAAVDLLTGEKNTEVKLKIKRSKSLQTEDITVERKPFIIKSVKHYKEEDVDIIKISHFGENTDIELKEILETHEFKNGIIIDLRNNPGGYLEVCTMIADQFLPKNSIITIIESKDKKEFIKAKNDAMDTKLVVLINENSASASELLAASLKENNRALIVGENSYGKGLIQNLGFYSDRYIKLTESEYKSPKGNLINKVGVSPHINVTLEEELFNLYSKLKPLISYTEFKKGDSYNELIGIKQRFNFLGSNLDITNVYDENLLKIVKLFKKEHNLKIDDKIDYKFKEMLDIEVENKAFERVESRQLKKAISEIKKMNK